MSALTEQEYFDKTIRHLHEQGRRASASTPTLDGGQTIGCMYETRRGLQCAVGVHMPQGHPARKCLGGVLELEEEHPDLAGVAWPLTKDGALLAQELQDLHDLPENWLPAGDGFGGWGRARAIAEMFDLKQNVIDELEVL